MGTAEFQRATDGWVDNAAEATRRAEELAKRALRSPDVQGHARAHSLLAAILSHQDRHEEALAQAERAIELNPSDYIALYWRGATLMSIGRIDEAIGVLETARRYEPYPSAGQGLNVALAYYVAGRPGPALQQTDALLARSPRNGFLHAMRAASLAQLGKLDEARSAADEVRRLNPAFDPDNFGTRFADPAYSARVREGLRKAGL
jgi:tetratricopeptide (TPR) repeat protein